MKKHGSEILKNNKFVLISSSPRRQEILESLAVDFVVKLPAKEVAEEIRDFHYKKDIFKVVKDKIEAVKSVKNKISIACDTIVVYNGRVFGKPVNNEQAVCFLKALAGKRHLVVSCLALKVNKNGCEKTLFGLEKTKVFFKQLTVQEITDYVATGEPFDKAGAYAIQGAGKSFIRKINGCYYNVVGFPVYQFYKLLERI